VKTLSILISLSLNLFSGLGLVGMGPSYAGVGLSWIREKWTHVNDWCL